MRELGLGVRLEVQVSFKRKKRLVSMLTSLSFFLKKKRLILTFSGEVWYAGVDVLGLGVSKEEGEVSQHRKVDSDGLVCGSCRPWDWV
jgi:hypothetical protein